MTCTFACTTPTVISETSAAAATNRVGAKSLADIRSFSELQVALDCKFVMDDSGIKRHQREFIVEMDVCNQRHAFHALSDLFERDRGIVVGPSLAQAQREALQSEDVLSANVVPAA